MFKMAKYYLILTLFQKTKRNIIALVVSLMLFVVTLYLFGDLIAMTESRGILIMAKWAVLLLLLVVMSFNLIQVLNAVRIPFSSENTSKTVDLRKEMIVSKEHLVNKSERIINKYRNQ